MRKMLKMQEYMFFYNWSKGRKPHFNISVAVKRPRDNYVFRKVESVQRKAAGFILIDYDRDRSVSKMIKKLNLDSTELRCKVKK